VEYRAPAIAGFAGDFFRQIITNNPKLMLQKLVAAFGEWQTSQPAAVSEHILLCLIATRQQLLNSIADGRFNCCCATQTAGITAGIV
jgi:hypothetical protein